MYVLYIYTYIHMYIYIYIYYIDIYTYIHIYVYVYTHTYVLDRDLDRIHPDQDFCWHRRRRELGAHASCSSATRKLAMELAKARPPFGENGGWWLSQAMRVYWWLNGDLMVIECWFNGFYWFWMVIEWWFNGSLLVLNGDWMVTLLFLSEI